MAASSLKTLESKKPHPPAGQAPFTHPKSPIRDESTVITATDRPAREFAESPGSRPRGSPCGDFYREDNLGWYATQWHRVPWYVREATNDTNIKRSELDLYGPGPYTGHKSAFSRDASIMVLQCRTSKKIALYDVATGKLRLKKR